MDEDRRENARDRRSKDRRTPEKFARLGAKIPKGALLVGPPAFAILQQERTSVEAVAARLLEVEVVDRDELRRLMGRRADGSAGHQRAAGHVPYIAAD